MKYLPGYELIDFGDGEKLECFGGVYLIRPEQNALGRKSMKNKEWTKIAHARYEEDSRTTGNWKFLKKEVKQEFQVSFLLKEKEMIFNLFLTSFMNVGIFPEQLQNWVVIRQLVEEMVSRPIHVLNLFGYTGAHSLAASMGGAGVTHVDSLATVLSWGKMNMIDSGLNGIRWLKDDVMKFVGREVTRRNSYQGIILDPPAFGRGPKGELWKIDDHLVTLLETLQRLLDKQGCFLLLNDYAGTPSVSKVSQLLERFATIRGEVTVWELVQIDSFGKALFKGVTGLYTSKRRKP